MHPMQTATTSRHRPTQPTLDALLPIADRVEALARNSGRAFIEQDSNLASSILAADGEHARLEMALEHAWLSLLGGGSAVGDLAVSAGIVTSLETISDLAATICGHVVGLDGTVTEPKSSIMKLAQMVPEMLKEALGALRTNDARSALGVLNRAPAADACFAQSHLDLFWQGQKDGRFESTQRLHAVTSALERIGDGATDIARLVCDTANAAH